MRIDPNVNDTLPFEGLQRQYNFRHGAERGDIFARLVKEHCQGCAKPVRVLDIGCGKGIELNLDRTREIRTVVDEFWGIEPDPSIKPEAGLFDNYQNALMETAELPENCFDLAYSFMVMEHVKDPGPFMKAVARCLKPGGTHFFATINGLHYFARIASTMRVLKLDELVLRAVVGSKQVETYHYPVFYRINTPSAIERFARDYGFAKPEFVFLEREGPWPYFPGPLKAVLWALQKKRDLIRNPRSLLVTFCKMRKL